MKTSFKSLSKLSGLTLISRVLGFLRDIFFASWFMNQPAFEAFLIAFQIPNFFRRLFAEGGMNQALVPTLSKLNTDDAKQLTAYCLFYLILAVSLIVLFANLAPNLVIRTFAHGLTAEDPRYHLAKTYIRVTSFFLYGTALSTLLGSLLQTYNKPASTAAAPIILNLCLITAAAVFNDCLALAYAVSLAGGLQVIFLYHQLKHHTPMRLMLKHSNMSKKTKKNIFMMLGLASPALVLQCMPLIDTYFASFLDTGAIATLYYAQRLVYLPLGIISFSIISVILPQKTRAFRLKNHDLYRKQVAWSIHNTLLFALPASLGLYFLSTPLISTLFMRGAFNAQNLQDTTNCLDYLAIGLPAFMLNKVLYNAFYAQLNRRIPTTITTLNIALTCLGNMLLIPLFGLNGIAMTSSATAWICTCILWGLIKKQNFYTFWQEHRPMLRLVLASSIMACYLHYGGDYIHETSTSLAPNNTVKLAFWLISAALLYFASLTLLGWRLQHITQVPECLHPDAQKNPT